MADDVAHDSRLDAVGHHLCPVGDLDHVAPTFAAAPMPKTP
jgi:hypothetical protein